VAERAPLGVGDHGLHDGDRHALADAGALVHALVVAREERHALDDFLHELGDLDARPVAPGPRLLARDVPADLELLGVVRADLRADAVLQRRDDLAARRVVLRVRREHHQQVERQADRVALHLHVPLLEDVEEAHLDLAGQVGQLVDREDAAVGARQQPEVDRELVGQDVAPARRLDRVDVADHVGDGDVGRGELLDVALLAPDPRDGRVVAVLLHERRPYLEIGASGSSLTSLPARIGISSSSRARADAGCGSSPARAGRAG
jgi:hypothetical protein